MYQSKPRSPHPVATYESSVAGGELGAQKGTSGETGNFKKQLQKDEK
jgi:hypothetical protein